MVAMVAVSVADTSCNMLVMNRVSARLTRIPTTMPIPTMREVSRSTSTRTLSLEAWREVDVVVAPSYRLGILGATNLTGQPCVVLPNGFRDDGTPVSISFLGNLYRDAEALQVAHAYQQATDFHLRRPRLA